MSELNQMLKDTENTLTEVSTEFIGQDNWFKGPQSKKEK